MSQTPWKLIWRDNVYRLKSKPSSLRGLREAFRTCKTMTLANSTVGDDAEEVQFRSSSGEDIRTDAALLEYFVAASDDGGGRRGAMSNASSSLPRIVAIDPSPVLPLSCSSPELYVPTSQALRGARLFLRDLVTPRQKRATEDRSHTPPTVTSDKPTGWTLTSTRNVTGIPFLYDAETSAVGTPMTTAEVLIVGPNGKELRKSAEGLSSYLNDQRELGFLSSLEVKVAPNSFSCIAYILSREGYPWVFLDPETKQVALQTMAVVMVPLAAQCALAWLLTLGEAEVASAVAASLIHPIAIGIGLIAGGVLAFRHLRRVKERKRVNSEASTCAQAKHPEGVFVCTWEEPQDKYIFRWTSALDDLDQAIHAHPGQFRSRCPDVAPV